MSANAERDEIKEALEKVCSVLSKFEKMVLTEYLSKKSFSQIHKSVCKKLRRKIRIQSIDDALMRIRFKAQRRINSEEVSDIRSMLDELSKEQGEL